jgi:hypothetical protein
MCDAPALHRPWPEDALRIWAKGEKEDRVATGVAPLLL